MGHRHLAILSAFLLYSVEHNARQNVTTPKLCITDFSWGGIEVIDVCQKVLEQGHGPQIGTSSHFFSSLIGWIYDDSLAILLDLLWILCGSYHYDVVIWKYTGIIHDVFFLTFNLWIFYVYLWYVNELQHISSSGAPDLRLQSLADVPQLDALDKTWVELFIARLFELEQQMMHLINIDMFMICSSRCFHCFGFPHVIPFQFFCCSSHVFFFFFF